MTELLALSAPPLLQEFNEAGVLAPADVHVARRLCEIRGEDDQAVALAVALAVRGPRLGHVYVDIAAVRETTAVDAEDEVDLTALGWPEPDNWLSRLRASSLVAVGEEDEGDGSTPLRLVGTALYLDRYWHEERQVADDLNALAGSMVDGVDDDLLTSGITRLFAPRPDARQAMACAVAVQRRLAVVAGGPGTGKTTTVARIVALLAEQTGSPLVALAAPTGKAAARLEEAVHGEAVELDVADAVRSQLLELKASTLHRLLGWRPDSQSRFRHNRWNRLPHDVVVVDETSMVSLSLMARLVEAVRPDARLVLVGDPGQLTSIEAGAVLGDIVGPAAGGLRMSDAARERVSRVVGAAVPAAEPDGDAAVADGIVVLERVHRFGAGIAALADAIRGGDPDAVIATLRSEAEGVTWIPEDVAEADAGALAPIREGTVAAGRALVEAARAGDAAESLAALGTFRVLCAHRRGPHGVAMWMDRVERWLSGAIDGFAAEGAWYPGRPLMVTENDYGLRLYNGDTGVVVATDGGRATAVFERGGDVVEFSPARLGAVETVYAMTVHKSQGSQFDTAAVLLPDATSQILTRELLYTAVTRAREDLILVATEDAIRTAVARPAARASGLSWRLWTSGGRPGS